MDASAVKVVQTFESDLGVELRNLKIQRLDELPITTENAVVGEHVACWVGTRLAGSIYKVVHLSINELASLLLYSMYAANKSLVATNATTYIMDKKYIETIQLSTCALCEMATSASPRVFIGIPCPLLMLP